jgi:hypothetical protein
MTTSYANSEEMKRVLRRHGARAASAYFSGMGPVDRAAWEQQFTPERARGVAANIYATGPLSFEIHAQGGVRDTALEEYTNAFVAIARAYCTGEL